MHAMSVQETFSQYNLSFIPVFTTVTKNTICIPAKEE